MAIFLGIIFVQSIFSLLIWPSFLLPDMNLFSALAVFILPIPCLVIVQMYSGKRLFVLFGLSHVACFLPAAILLLQMKYHVWIGFIIWFMVGLSTFAIAGLTGVWGRLVIRRMPWAMVFVAPSLMLFVEYLMILLSQTFILIPPPETLYAYPLVAIPPLIQIASFTGVLGASALVAFFATTAAVVLREKILANPRWREQLKIDPDVVPFSVPDRKKVLWGSVAVGVGLLLLVVLGNVEAVRVAQQQAASDRSVKAALLQAQFDPATTGKWNRTVENTAVRIYRTMMMQAKEKDAEILFFTENAFPMVLPRSQRLWEEVREVIREVELSAIIGVITEVDKDLSYNMWYQLNTLGEIEGYYTKQALVPFGEYLPLRKVIDPVIAVINRIFNTTYSLFKLTAIEYDNYDLAQGKESKLFSVNDGKIFLAVCDEIMYSKYFRAGVALGGEAVFAPNASNWFQRPAYFNRRLQMTAFRAVETRRWIGQLSSMGGSAFVDALGIIRHASPFATRSVNVQIVPLLTGKTLYVQWGDWFAWFWLAILFGFSMAAFIFSRWKRST
ncbi:apolipoprotein N-acyltransferase [bacterium]|nr:apolipoprotein N-acyltransferase [bacterium]